jgi:hypothetical protein
MRTVSGKHNVARRVVAIIITLGAAAGAFVPIIADAQTAYGPGYYCRARSSHGGFGWA